VLIVGRASVGFVVDLDQVGDGVEAAQQAHGVPVLLVERELHQHSDSRARIPVTFLC